MITPSFSLTATERVLPKLALDFTTASLDPRVTFTRVGDTATVTNSSGYIASISANLPRFDYNPITLVCKGLLIEEARTNNLLYSEDFSNIIWVKSAVDVTQNSTNSPGNTLSADTIVPNTTSSAKFFYQDSAVISGNTYTQTLYAKAAGYSFLQITTSSGLTPSLYANFNLTTGAVGGTNGGAATITSVGNGWYRCSYAVAANATQAGRFLISIVSSSTSARIEAFAGDGISGVYVWGAQIEAGAFATSYIPTTTTALTRNADVATMTGTNFSDWYNQDEGAITTSFISNTPSSLSSSNMFCSFSNASSNSIIYFSKNTSALARMQLNNLGAAQVDLTSSAITTGAITTITGAYKANSFAFDKDGGVTIATDNAGSVASSVEKLHIGSVLGVANFANACIQKLNYYPQRIINAEVQAFSKG